MKTSTPEKIAITLPFGCSCLGILIWLSLVGLVIAALAKYVFS